MTELEFWAALVTDYVHTAQRLPTLTANKIRGGVPPPLRGVVWPSVAGARDAKLHEDYQRLSIERSPYEGLIGKDVGRSFPNIDMFKERDGEGQSMLGNVLKAFSLYDDEIGYCQGLGFVVGPLLMHMSEPEAFCILVRLMEHYDLRSCYLPDLAGLHLRIYQFQALLKRHLPELAAHLDSLKIEPLYVSQWFLSFFAVTCPLPMLLRIYDVILAEGATETLMRVALSLMQRNEQKLRSLTEFEDAMQFLLSRGLWDTYVQHADDLVNSFVSLTGLVSAESLQALDKEFKESKALAPPTSLKSTASSILGRFWAGSTHSISRSANNLSLVIPGVGLRKTSSGQSLTSIVNSTESTSDATTVATEISGVPLKTDLSHAAGRDSDPARTDDKSLHHQIEELLTALSELQRQQIDMARDLQREREERAEDREIAKSLLESLRTQSSAIQELADGDLSAEDLTLEGLIATAETHFVVFETKRMSIVQSKRQLRDTASEWKDRHDLENARCQDLMRQLDEREKEQGDLKEHLREARGRIQDAYREKQKLERTVQELRARKPSLPESPCDLYSPISDSGDRSLSPTPTGLRELRLGKPDTASLNATFAKRSSSLNTQAIFATENHQPITEDALLLELVNAKTAEAVARQELEETRGKLEALRKIVSGPISTPMRPPTSEPVTPGSPGSDGGTPKVTIEKTIVDSVHNKTASTSGGFFSGWGRRGT